MGWVLQVFSSEPLHTSSHIFFILYIPSYTKTTKKRLFYHPTPPPLILNIPLNYKGTFLKKGVETVPVWNATHPCMPPAFNSTPVSPTHEGMTSKESRIKWLILQLKKGQFWFIWPKQMHKAYKTHTSWYLLLRDHASSSCLDHQLRSMDKVSNSSFDGRLFSLDHNSVSQSH